MAWSDNSRGALLMALAMAVFTFNDALIKTVSAELSIGQILAVRGVMSAVVIYAIARTMGVAISFRAMTQPIVLLRTGLEMCATFTFISALQRIEFAAMSSIMQSLPLAVTLGAALFLREGVGWRRWSAIVIGFLGVLIIIRPGPEGFTTASLFAVAAVLFTAARDLLTRRISAEIPTISITLFTTLAVTVVGSALIVPMGGWKPVSGQMLLYMALASVLVPAGYQAIIAAMRSGEVSFVAPFRYMSLIFGLIIAVTVFGERPSLSMLAGAVIIIGSGLYTFYRERQRGSAIARKASAAPPA